MSDLISRQVALVAVKDALMAWSYMPEWRDEKILEAIAELPSAQPEIVRCKDCDWWTKQEDSPQGRCELLQMYPTGGWFCGNARRREVTE